MNRKLKYILSVVVVLILGSCSEDFLNVVPEDQITTDGFFRNAEEIRRVTGAVYGSAWFDANDKFLWCAGDGMPGDLLQNYADEGQLFAMTFTESNTVVLQGWRGLYRVIAGANSIINDMPPIAKGYGVPEADINAGLAEARFLRGTAYYFLAEFWGDVPIIENASEIVSSGNLLVPRHTRASVYEFIRRDLEFAAANLPLTDAPGRVTSWSAKGMLAKLHLTMASTLDGNSAENFAKAKEVALDVLVNSGLHLLGKYEDLFKAENNNNEESLFALQFTGGSYGIGNSHQANLARNTLITGISEGWGGGKSLTDDFIENLKENSEDETTGQPKNDLRRKSIYMQLGDHYPEIHKAYGGYTYNIHRRYPVDYADPAFRDQTETAAPVLNNVKKYVLGNADDVGSSISNQATPINQYVLRLADVNLIYVEATIGAGSGTSDATALKYYNEVRERAGLTPRTSVDYIELFDERRVEFGMEGINWFDVKRRFYRNEQEAINYLNGGTRNHQYALIDDSSDDLERNTEAAYALTPPTTPFSVTSREKMFLPIPAQEVTSNALLGLAVEESVTYVFK